MQALHSANEPRVQVSILNDETLDAAIIDSPEYERRSTSAWRAKVNAAPSERDNRRTIIKDWLDEIYDSDHAIFLFKLFKLHIGAHRGSSYDLMAHAAVKEFGYVRLPERVSDPIPRSYADSDLVAALAPARAGGTSNG